MGEVQRAPLIVLDRDVEHGRAVLDDRVQVHVVAVLRGDELGASEAVLQWATPWKEDRGVVDRDRDDLFVWQDEGPVPEGGGQYGVS